MEKKNILIVDDEKNIRFTLSQALESLNLPLDTAADGKEALAKLEQEEFGLMLLDLKMPGMDGMEVLRRVRETHPKIRVIIITAHGTIESAVEAMKLGAADFIQKPFSPAEIRELVSRVLERERLSDDITEDYWKLIELAKRHINEEKFTEAALITRKAIAADPRQPESYNILGALLEINGDLLEALKFYRAALDIDPTYKPAKANLSRATTWNAHGKIHLGNDLNEHSKQR